MKKYLIIIVFTLVSLPLWGQANAGPDKVKCNENAVQIGTSGNGGSCYKWTPETGLSDPTSPMPMANPTKTTVYTLTVVDENFNTSTDQVEVKVSVGEISFNPPSLMTGSQSQTTASVSYLEVGETIAWSIEGNALGATINSSTGVITAGNTDGTITVKATAQPSGCETKKNLDIGGVSDVTATDLNPQGSAPRVAHAGDILYLVDDNGAKIKAIPTEGSFPSGYPKWSGFSNPPADGTVSFNSQNSSSETYTTGSKNVRVERIAKSKHEAQFGSFTPNNIKNKLKNALNFKAGGAEFSVVVLLGSTSFSREKVEKYGDPDYGYKSGVTLGVSGKVTGKISAPPPYSGTYTVFGKGLKYGLFAEASVALATSGSIAYDPSLPNSSWTELAALNMTLTGEVKVGIEVELDVSFLKVGGEFSASTGLSGTLALSGCKLQTTVGWNGISGQATFKVYRSDPNDPYFTYNYTRTFIPGKSLGPYVIMNLCE